MIKIKKKYENILRKVVSKEFVIEVDTGEEKIEVEIQKWWEIDELSGVYDSGWDFASAKEMEKVEKLGEKFADDFTDFVYDLE